MRAAFLFLAACTSVGTTTDPGLASHVRIANSQYIEGAMPRSTGPAMVTGIDSLNNTIFAGQVNKALAGRISNGGEAVAIGFADDPGFWIVPAGPMDVTLPDQLTWSAKASFDDTLEPGPHDLIVEAIDGNRAFGPPNTLTLTVQSRQLDLSGSKLAVSLSWDTEADLDLHLVLPDGTIVWSGNLNSYVPPPPGDPMDPNAAAAGGILDFDSNAQCLIDGRREENIVWRGPMAAPPAGGYRVLVDTFSLCAATTAHWDVDVFRDGNDQSTAHAEGTVTEADTRGAHEASSGVQALTFDL
ncbi:MAG: hypothetical protein JO257_26940 [Deltaproteobacteria bacterium]|nr:hypothetical protein [Deltaproteobacteria bacterium]